MASVPELADIALLDTSDRIVRLGDLWSERPAIVVWIRHYR